MEAIYCDVMVQEHSGNFSGSEKQRIAIARAILKNASVVIFDETTNAVNSAEYFPIASGFDNAPVL